MTEIELRVARELSSAVTQLRSAAVPLEALARYVPPRRKLFVRRAATMEPLGEVWRLGRLLLGPGCGSDTDGEEVTPKLFVSNHTTRSAPRLHPGNQSVSREERRDIATAALKGGYPEGTVVNYEAAPILLNEASLRALDDRSPLGLCTGATGLELRVRWRAGAPLEGAPTLESYLAERIELLVHPPQSV